MEKLKLNYLSIQDTAPTAWQDFLNFYKTEFNSYSFLRDTDFTNLPFEMQLGILLRYFKDNGVELDVCNTDYNYLPQTIQGAFAIYEKVISHYS